MSSILVKQFKAFSSELEIRIVAWKKGLEQKCGLAKHRESNWNLGMGEVAHWVWEPLCLITISNPYHSYKKCSSFKYKWPLTCSFGVVYSNFLCIYH